eukprot:7313685-Pyramimonas_sp.AAC.1
MKDTSGKIGKKKRPIPFRAKADVNVPFTRDGIAMWTSPDHEVSREMVDYMTALGNLVEQKVKVHHGAFEGRGEKWPGRLGRVGADLPEF